MGSLCFLLEEKVVGVATVHLISVYSNSPDTRLFCAVVYMPPQEDVTVLRVWHCFGFLLLPRLLAPKTPNTHPLQALQRSPRLTSSHFSFSRFRSLFSSCHPSLPPPFVPYFRSHFFNLPFSYRFHFPIYFPIICLSSCILFVFL